MSRIVSLNVNSVKSFHKKKLLEAFVTDNRADIYFLSETHLSSNDNLQIKNYNIFRQDRNHKNGGGTAILLNTAINFRNTKTNDSDIEFTSIEVFLNNNWLVIMSIYVPPNLKPQISIDSIANIFNSKLPIIAGGDFNARHESFGDSSNNFNGIKFREFLDGGEFTGIHSNVPTCFRSESGSFIDFFIVCNSIIQPAPMICEAFDAFSDHRAIALNFAYNFNTNNANILKTVKMYNIILPR